MAARKKPSPPLVPAFVHNERTVSRADGLACVLCNLPDASPRPFLNNAVLCGGCTRRNLVGHGVDFLIRELIAGNGRKLLE